MSYPDFSIEADTRNVSPHDAVAPSPSSLSSNAQTASTVPVEQPQQPPTGRAVR